ncbi:MAG: amino acid adenylation domain-containing protein [Agarilytica sp.]
MGSPNKSWPLDVNLVDLIVESVRFNQQLPAVFFGESSLTYQELNDRSDAYARYLKSVGVAQDDVVAVLQDRSLELVVSLLGILKAGGAYLPLDPSHPSSRLQFVLDDADVSVVLTQSDYVECLGDFLGTVRCVDEPDVWLPREESKGAASTVDVEISPADLAYVIYTSGSTGQPKGCMLPHQAICNRLQWMQSEYGLGLDDRVLQKTPYTFDVSVWEFFWPLLTGASIVMADPGGHKDNHYLVRTIQSQQVTVCHFVPSMLRFFLNAADVSSCTSLKKIFVSGEALPHELVVQFNETLPHCELHNLYGPTEAAVDVSYWPCSPREDGVVPIGKAITNIDLYLLDASLQPVEDGQEGELFIGGIGLARGYLNRPELTAERFLPNPYSEQADARMYRTGDLAYRLPDGNIAYVGRTDFQVKLRGLRIELGEIESCLRTYPGVTEAAVLVRDETDDPKLVAYLESDTALNSKKVRQHCAQDLPEYMVPNVVAGLSQLPVTPHGKLDRKALPWPLGEREQSPQSSGPISEQAPKETRVDNATDTGKAKSLPSTFSETELTTHVSGYVCEVLRRESLAPDDDLFDLGATSLSLVRVVEKIQQGLGCVVPVDVFLDHPSVAGIVQYLQSQGVGVDASVGVSVDASEEKASTQSEAVANAGTPSSSVRDSLHETVSAIVCDILRRESIEASDDFFDLGATSLSLVRVTEKIQQQLDIVVPVDVFLDAPSVQGVCDYLSQQKNCSHVNQTQEQTPSQEPLPEQEPSLEQKNIHLDAVQFQPAFYQQCIRAEGFDSKSVPCNAFSSWLGLLQLQEREGRGRYLYPSGGGFNPVRTYISVNDNAVEGLAGGSYYYDPQAHQLYRVGDAQVPVEHCHSFDQGAASQAGFALYFVVSLDAIAPIYGEVCRPLAALESGYMVQLLQSRQQVFGLGLRPLVTCDIDAIRQGFALNPSERFVLGLVGGANLESSPVHERKSFAQYLEHQSKPLCISDKPDSIQLRHEGDDPFTKAQQLSKPLLEEFHSAHHQFRRFGSEVTPIALSSADFAWDDYRLRACQREYQDDVVEQGQLTRLLALSQMNAQSQSLYVDVIGTPCVTLYVYVKAGRVQGLQAGVYRYDNDRHELHFCSGIDESRMAMAYTPFNRQHFKRAAFCVYMVQREGLSALSPERAQHLSYVSAGALGQVMMERQAEFSLGLCPIGAVRFDKISDAFGVSSGTSVLQSFTCGVYAQEIPVDRVCLESDPLREVGRLSASLASATAQEDDRSSAGQSRQSSENDIAIVGMSGVYPGADNLDQFWNNLKNGKVSIGEMSDERLAELGLASFDIKGGFLTNTSSFDSLLFNISPAEARMMDPQERLLLQQAWACLEDAGYTAKNLKKVCETVGVYVGAMWSDYQSQGVDRWQNKGEVKESSYHAALANRVSYFFDFDGPSLAINTSCSSAMTALHTACQNIQLGEIDAALVGGVNLISHQYHTDLLRQQEYLTQHDACKPLSSEADGWSIGEGVGVFLLKPLANALENRDQIYGVIKSSATAHSGRSVRFGAPNASSQSKCIKRLINKLGDEHKAIDYIELASPGASMADAAEVSALTQAIRSKPQDNIFISSVKGNVGHLESASAVSQLSKVLLQFKNNAWVPSVNNQPVSPLLGLGEETGFRINENFKPWQNENPKRALINVIGAAGSESHIILDSYPKIQEKNNDQQKTKVLIPLSAETESQIYSLARSLLYFVNKNKADITDISYTLVEGRESLKERVVFSADNIEGLKRCIEKYISGESNENIILPACHDNYDGKYVVSSVKNWVEGLEDTLITLSESVGRRISLPTYPFATNCHWIDKSGEDYSNLPVFGNQNGSQGSDKSGELYDTVSSYIRQILSAVTEIPKENIRDNVEFDRLGLTSLMIEKATIALREEYNPLPTSVIFQNRNIEQLTNHILSNCIVDKPSSNPNNDSNSASHFSRKRVVEESNAFNKNENGIAIVGIACKFPGANNPFEFWENLKNGQDSITEIPNDRWDHREYFSTDKNAKGSTYSKWGGFIDGMDEFDPLFFNMTPREAELVDPQERQLLMRTYEAFEDAGYTRKKIQEKTNGKVSVFVGAMYNEYQLYQHNSNGTGHTTCLSTIANRISYFYDFNAPSMAVDTMCSASLTAIHLACESISKGESRWAVAGGVNLNLHPNKYVTHASMTMSSSHGRCKAFSSDGDGFVPSEGVGVVILKPVDEALRDGDQIYGVIKSTVINHGGKTNGFTVPDPQAHKALIEQAWKKTTSDPNSLSYIEAHGTGTKLGDPIEIEGINAALTAVGKQTTSAIGSVKSNIGHCESAAGIAGLIKVLLQMRYKLLVPSLHTSELNDSIDFARANLHVQRKLEAWTPLNQQGKPCTRMASISSFGAGGSNAYLIVEEAPESCNKVGQCNTSGLPVFPVSAKNLSQMRDYISTLRQFLETHDVDLTSLAYSMQARRDSYAYRSSFVSDTKEELIVALKDAEKKNHDLFISTEENESSIEFLKDKDVSRLVFEKIRSNNQWVKLSRLWESGVEVDWDYFWSGKKPSMVSFPAYSFKRDRYWKGDLNPSTTQKSVTKNTNKKPDLGRISKVLVDLESRRIGIDEAFKRTADDA